MFSSESPVAFSAAGSSVTLAMTSERLTGRQAASSDIPNYATSTPCFSDAADLHQDKERCSRAALSDSGYSTIVKLGNRRLSNADNFSCPPFSLDSTVQSLSCCFDEIAATSVSGSVTCDLSSSPAAVTESMSDSGCLSGFSEHELQVEMDEMAVGTLSQACDFVTQPDVIPSVPVQQPNREHMIDHKSSISDRPSFLGIAYVDFIAELQRQDLKHVLRQLFNFLKSTDLLR
jgi:hypothetical protein